MTRKNPLATEAARAPDNGQDPGAADDGMPIQSLIELIGLGGLGGWIGLIAAWYGLQALSHSALAFGLQSLALTAGDLQQAQAGGMFAGLPAPLVAIDPFTSPWHALGQAWRMPLDAAAQVGLPAPGR